MANKTTIIWQGDMAFDAELDEHHFFIDAHEANGGKDSGPRPKGLLLTALAGCTGMDVVSILAKMKIRDFKLSIDVEGEQTNEHPKYYNLIVVRYQFLGDNLPIDKLKRAVELSETRYCGVSAMLRKAATIEAEIYLNGELI
jgi:putative redox protein